MRAVGVVIVTLCGLLACGKDPILEQAEAEAAAAKEARPAGQAPAGTPTPPAPGTPEGGKPAGEGAPTPMGPDGQPLPGAPDEPTPGVPTEPAPGAPGSPQLAVAGGAPAVKPGAPAPGVPVEPKPGIPSEPPPGGGGGGPKGPTVVLSGVVTYPDWKKGKVKISAFDGDHGTTGGGRPNVVAMAEVDKPGPFTIAVAENAGKIYLEAAIDEDGDGRPGPLDPQGHATRFPVTVAAKPVDGLEILLTRRAPPPGGRGEDF